MFQGDTALPFDDVDTDDWTFHKADTRHGTHVYHDYPARMIPQIAAKLLTRYGAGAARLFDPYCGTGTSLVEGMAHGLTVVGTDLNPLARLIARAKTTLPDALTLTDEIRRFEQFVNNLFPIRFDEAFALPGIDRLCFWFTPVVVVRLRRVEAFVSEIDDADVQQFFAVAFSETVRDCSNTRSHEFKLYRYAEKDLAVRSPDVLATMQAKLHRNRAGLGAFRQRVSRLAFVPSATVYDFNTVTAIPENIIAPSSVDLVVTSPPYGDSVTTVAYGQYSRLSAAWLRLPEPEKTDRRLMGGTPVKTIREFPSPDLNAALAQIADADAKRGGEVSAFYADLLASVRNVAATIRRG
ncbi:MAG: DNA methyltransferase, partial [Armatimonadetes bacterium]|nr:DNA methyltransferase [Armatimonadota bacterium]